MTRTTRWLPEALALSASPVIYAINLAKPRRSRVKYPQRLDNSMSRRNQKESSGKSAAGLAYSVFNPKKVSSVAKADAIASREAIQISGGNASGGNASLQEPGDIFEPLEDRLASSLEGEMAKELAKIAKLIKDTAAAQEMRLEMKLAKLQETATEQDKKLSAQDKKLDDIKRSTSAVEA